MTCGQASDVDRRRLGNHIPLHTDRERAIVGAFHVNPRNAAEALRRHMNLCHECRESLWPQPGARIGDVCIGAIVIENLTNLIGHDRPADPVCIESHADRYNGFRIAMFDVEQRFTVLREEGAQINQRLDVVGTSCR